MCQEFPKEKWIDAQKENVLDAPYYHVVFTVPEELNPHIHIIVLGGGLDKDNKWKDTGGKFFLPYGVIAKVFRGKYLCELKSLWNDSKLEFHGTAEKYQNHYCFKELLDVSAIKKTGLLIVRKHLMEHSQSSIILGNILTG